MPAEPTPARPPANTPPITPDPGVGAPTNLDPPPITPPPIDPGIPPIDPGIPPINPGIPPIDPGIPPISPGIPPIDPIPGFGPSDPPPVGVPGVTPTPATTPAGGTSTPARGNSGTLTISVPAGSKVFINGMETTSTGKQREYVSHGLQPGLEYKYEIRAEVLCQRTQGPQVVEKRKIPLTRTVYLRAGDHEHLAFSPDVATIAGVWQDPERGDIPYEQVFVIDDELKRIQERVAAIKQAPAGDRPPHWINPTPVRGY